MLRRLATAGTTAFAATLAAFLAAHALPGDPAAMALFAQGTVPTADAITALRAEHGLDAPAWSRYLTWIAGILTGNWGTSLRTGEPVLAGLLARLPVSLTIGLGGLMLGTVIAAMLGYAAAAGSRLGDVTSRSLAILAQGFPVFCTGLLVIFVFGVQLQWIKPFTAGPIERMIAPLVLVAIYTSGALARLVRREMLAAAGAPWFRAARAKGLSSSQALRRHAGPFGALALIAALRAEAAWVVGGTAVTEVLFGAPGISSWVVESVAHRDLAVLQGYVLVVAGWMLVVHMALDATRRRIDPRHTR